MALYPISLPMHAVRLINCSLSFPKAMEVDKLLSGMVVLSPESTRLLSLKLALIIT